jgi:hypothetical protein
VFEIAEPDDASFAVRRAAVVSRHEPFDADRAGAALRHVHQRGAAG